MSLRTKIISAVAIIGILLIIIFARGFSSSVSGQKTIKETDQNQTEQDQKVELVSTNPANLDNSTISPNQTIELNFNYPVDEQFQKFPISLEPNVEHKIEMANGGKTVRITPTKSFGFNQGYGIEIKEGAPFQGGKKLDHDLGIHFYTTSYSGV